MPFIKKYVTSLFCRLHLLPTAASLTNVGTRELNARNKQYTIARCVK